MLRINKLAFIALTLIAQASGALGVGVVWEARTTGSDTNGGGFEIASGTDMSIFPNKNATSCISCQSATNNLSTVDLVTNGTTTVTSATATFTSALVKNVVFISGGTGAVSAGWYEVTTVTNATTMVLDRATGLTSGTGATINIGGALLSPAVAVAQAVTGNTIYLLNGGSVFSMTSATNGVSGGAINTSLNIFVVGYLTNRTLLNTDSPPTVQGNVASLTMLGNSSSAMFVNLILDGNSQTASKLAILANTIRCTAKNFNTTSGGGVYFASTATTNSAAVFVGTVVYSEAYSNTATPILCVTCMNNISYSNTGSGFSVSGTTGVVLKSNAAIGNSVSGFLISSAIVAVLLDNIAEANTSFGFNLTSPLKVFLNNAVFGNNGVGSQINSTTGLATTGLVTLTSSAFTNVAGNVFTLNNTSGAGASLRGAAYLALFPRGLTSAFADIGPSQHQDTGAATAATTVYPIGN